MAARLSGRALDMEFTEAVVDVCSQDHATAAPRLVQARELWACVRSHTAAPLSGPQDLSGDGSGQAQLVRNQQYTIEAQGQLLRALEAKTRSDQALSNSTQLVLLLVQMINQLQVNISDLQRRADSLVVDEDPYPEANTRVLLKLRTAQDQLRQAEEERARAETERREALQLRDVAQRRAEALQHDLDLLRNGAESAPGTSNDHLPAPTPEAADSEELFLRDVAQALAKARTVNEQSEQLTREAREDLDLDDRTVQTNGPSGPESGVRGNHETDQDNPLSSDFRWDNSAGTEGSDAGSEDWRAAAEGGQPRQPTNEMRTLNRGIADINSARSLGGTLQAVVEGAVVNLGFDSAAVHLVRPDGDLVVAAVWAVSDDDSSGVDGEVEKLLGQVGSDESWRRLMAAGERWGELIFIDHQRSGAVHGPVPERPVTAATTQEQQVPWDPEDMLLAPMYSLGGELLGVLCVDRPRNGLRPSSSAREALEMFCQQASIAIGNARLRAELQRSLVRMQRERAAIEASEEGFRSAFEFAPSGVVITDQNSEHGRTDGRMSQVNDAFCRLLGRSSAGLRRLSLVSLAHPEDRPLVERTLAVGGRAEVRLEHQSGSYLWVNLRTSMVVDATAKGPHFLLTHVDDIEPKNRPHGPSGTQ